MKNSGRKKHNKTVKLNSDESRSSPKKSNSGKTEITGSQSEYFIFTGNDINIHKILNPGWISDGKMNPIEKSKYKFNKLKTKRKKQNEKN